MTEVIEVRPKPGPQTEFLATSADIAFFGGRAGTGKTRIVCHDCLRWVHLRGFVAAYFRRDKERFDALWEEQSKLFPLRGGIGARNDLRWRFPSGARVQCFGLRGLDVDREKHRGPRYGCIYFEEVTEISEADFFFLVSRNGSTIPGFRSYVRATCNPQAKGWVRTFLDWWIDDKGWPIRERCGVLRWFVRSDANRFEWADTREELVERFPDRAPLSVTFIPGGEIVEELGEEYRAKLDALPTHQRRADALGNWNAHEAKGDWWKRDLFKLVPFVPPEAGRIVRRQRAWDLAGTRPSKDNPDPDWTRGMRMSWTDRANLILEDGVSLRDGPSEVEDLVMRTTRLDADEARVEEMRTGRALPPVEVTLWQDPAQAGKYQMREFSARLSGYIVNTNPARQNLRTLARVWAPWPKAGRVYVVAGDWNEDFFTEVEDFPHGHDDWIAAVTNGVVTFTSHVQTRSIRVRGA